VPSQNNKPKPRPDNVVKTMTDGAGFMSDLREGAIEPRNEALYLLRDWGKERREHVDLLWLVQLVARAGWQIFVDGLGALLGHEIKAAAFGGELAHMAIGVGKIAEMARASRAGAHTGGFAIF